MDLGTLITASKVSGAEDNTFWVVYVSMAENVTPSPAAVTHTDTNDASIITVQKTAKNLFMSNIQANIYNLII